jgi:hypothetical protein
VGPEVRFEDGLELRERPDHDLLVEILQSVDHCLGHEIGPRRQHLADLDVERSETLQRLADGPGLGLLELIGVVELVAAALPAELGLPGHQLAEHGRHLEHPLALPHDPRSSENGTSVRVRLRAPPAGAGPPGVWRPD